MGPRLRRLAAAVVVVPVLLVGAAAEAEGVVAPEPSVVAADLRPPTTGVGPRPGARGTVPDGGWTWPLRPHPVVVARFDPPEVVAWGSGHRGVDLAASVGQDVVAPVAGTVTFSGVVVDRGVVVVTTASGLRTTVEPVQGSVRAGAAVTTGEVIGQLRDAPGHCAPGVCLHWGVLRGETYLDPLALLGLRRVVLLPLAPLAPLAPP